MRKILRIMVLVIFILGLPALACGGSVSEEAPSFDKPATPPGIAKPSSSDAVGTGGGAVSAPAAEPGTWLIMLYQNADDEVLEQDIFIDLNEAEMVGSSDKVKIVSQMDRYKGAFEGDGNWTTVKRFFVTQDDDLDHIASEEIEDLGELDSGDWHTLADFGEWAIKTYPAEKYMLVLSDHGAGWLGGWNDDDPRPESAFTTNDIDSALAEIIARTGIPRFEVVGFDACLMSQYEAVSAVAPYAAYAVASQETEPALGWAYASFLSDLVANPSMSGADLAKNIVASYIVADGRITNDGARSVFLEENQMDERMSAREVAAEMSTDITLTAVDMAGFRELNLAVNNLAVALAQVNQEDVAWARTHAQAYSSVFGDDVPPSYIDLGSFAGLLARRIDDAGLQDAVLQIQNALKKAVIAEKHGPERPGSTGFTIYFPTSRVYRATVNPKTQPNYTDYASRFAVASLWDDFLLYHYKKIEMEPTAVDVDVLNPVRPAAAAIEVPAPSGSASGTEQEVVAPGAEKIGIAPITASATKISQDGVITLSTTISGRNVAYIYLYTMFYDDKTQSFLVANMDFIASDDTKEINGLYYPDWGSDGTFPLEVDWEPTIYFMTDGNEANDQFAYFEPEIYGVKEKDDVYSVRGIYTFAKSGDQRGAELKFSGDGKNKTVLVYMNQDGSGAPRRVTPKQGDTFTITEQWLEFTQNPDGEFVDYEGGTMTFGKKPLEWVPYYGFPGKYMIGIVVEDFDGNLYPEFVEVTVTD